MDIAKGLIALLVLGMVFGGMVLPTYMQMTNQPMWTDLSAVAPGWFIAALKFMPVIAALGLFYGIYKHFAHKKDQRQQPPIDWPEV